jgi:hypothetical protein
MFTECRHQLTKIRDGFSLLIVIFWLKLININSIFGTIQNVPRGFRELIQYRKSLFKSRNSWWRLQNKRKLSTIFKTKCTKTAYLSFKMINFDIIIIIIIIQIVLNPNTKRYFYYCFFIWSYLWKSSSEMLLQK